MLESCAITGHRPTRFVFKYNENHTDCKRLKKHLRDQFLLLYERGVRRFWIGGALGVDMWSGEILLRLKEESGYGNVELMLALPFEGHDRGWDARSRARLAFLRQHSTGTIILGASNQGAAENYRCRNQFMVDHADCLLAVIDNDRSFRSGTGMTVRYAEKKHIPIILIHPDTSMVVQLEKNI